MTRATPCAHGDRGVLAGGLADAVSAARIRPEDHVPVGDAYAEAALVVFEMVPHMELTEPSPEAALGPGVMQREVQHVVEQVLSLIHISEPTRRTPISYAVFCLKKKKKKT